MNGIVLNNYVKEQKTSVLSRLFSSKNSIKLWTFEIERNRFLIKLETMYTLLNVTNILNKKPNIEKAKLQFGHDPKATL